MRVEHFLEEAARRYPEKTALVTGDRRTTYGEFERAANRIANLLLQSGLRRGDRVVLFLDNSFEAVAAIFGVLKANGIYSIVNTQTKASKLAFIAKDLAPRFVVTQARWAAVCDEAVAGVPSVERVWIAGLAGAPATTPGPLHADLASAMNASVETRPSPPACDQDLAYVMYTSGSTGFPKGVMVTHQSSVAGVRSITSYLENVHDDVILSVVPLSFDYGMYQAIMCASFGGTLILEQSLVFANAVLRKMVAEKVTGFPVVPTTAAIVLGIKGLKPEALPKLRYITNTAAPLPPAHSARLQELFPSARIYCNYGLTETIRSTYLPPSELKNRPTSVGKAMPNTEAYIVDDRGNPLPFGSTGELVLRGAPLFKGYWNNPTATEAMLRPGPHPWERVLYPGDVFRTDDEGFLYYVGRKDDMFKSRGEKIEPREIENVLYQLESVREAAVIGVPDPVQGLSVRAVLALQPGHALSQRDVQVHCAKYVEDYMVPSSVEIRDELPKTESGKIKRRELQDEAARTAAGDAGPRA